MTSNNQKEIEKIKSSYVAKSSELTKLDELKALDRKVKRPPTIFAYIYGIVGSLVLGVGMCLAMEVIGNLMPLGIVIGLLGIVMVSTTYPIFHKILNRRKSIYSEEILKKSNELLNK